MTPRRLLEPARLAGHALLRAQPDDRLVDLVRAGNDRAFEALVERHRRPLQRYCRRLLGPGRDEDALQQVFLKAHAAIHATDGPFALQAWLFRVAHNTSLNLLRRRDCSYEELPDGLEEPDRPDQAFERGERLRAVLTAVQALPARQRNAIVLRELAGRSHDEIAAELGVSGGAARQLISRARDAVRATAAALTPLPLLTRLTEGGAAAPTAARITELTAAAGATATAAKVGATVAVTALIAGGAGHVPKLGGANNAKGAPTSADTAHEGQGVRGDGLDGSGSIRARAADGAGGEPNERRKRDAARSVGAGRDDDRPGERDDTRSDEHSGRKDGDDGDAEHEDAPQARSEETDEPDDHDDGDGFDDDREDPDDSDAFDDERAGDDDQSDDEPDELDDDHDGDDESLSAQSLSDLSRDEGDEERADEDD